MDKDSYLDKCVLSKRGYYPCAASVRGFYSFADISLCSWAGEINLNSLTLKDVGQRQSCH